MTSYRYDMIIPTQKNVNAPTKKKHKCKANSILSSSCLRRNVRVLRVVNTVL